MTFVLDTNIISFYLKGHELVANNIASALIKGHNILIAPIAYYEIKRGLMAVNSQQRLKEFNSFCELFGVGQFNNSILDAAAEIYVEQRKKGHTIDDADIFIAAYCRNQQHTLVTNNIKHFEHIAGLTLLDWTLPHPA
ncbi:MAG: type II toxin-antitoxin system VapC family toxin [Prevotellaceae bacterium]|jgi:tRNA(fMet)-specific endonuclease VapC|nr:type II toxin-antitoxin system VapC family toxin [Prevotellaceae bacterium]